MNAEQIKSSITFQLVDAQCGAKELIGTFQIHSSVKIDPNYPNVEKQAKALIREDILRMLYDDQRRELRDAIKALEVAQPYSPRYGEAIDRLMKAAKYQPESDTMIAEHDKRYD